MGYHMPFPSVGYIGCAGGAFRWESVSYQFARTKQPSEETWPLCKKVPKNVTEC